MQRQIQTLISKNRINLTMQKKRKFVGLRLTFVGVHVMLAEDSGGIGSTVRPPAPWFNSEKMLENIGDLHGWAHSGRIEGSVGLSKRLS